MHELFVSQNEKMELKCHFGIMYTYSFVVYMKLVEIHYNIYNAVISIIFNLTAVSGHSVRNINLLECGQALLDSY